MNKTIVTGIGVLALLAMMTAAVPAFAAGQPCPPCQAFDRLDKQVRDGALSKVETERQFAARIAELDTLLVGTGTPAGSHWIFPLRGYDLATSGADAIRGYVAAGYDFFDGNRHGGHPAAPI